MIRKLVFKDVAYYEDAFDNVEEIVSTIKELSCLSVSDWEPWYAGGGGGHQYGHVKHMDRFALRGETDLATKEKSKWLMDTLIAGMRDAALDYAELFEVHEVFVRFAIKAMHHERSKLGVSYYLPQRSMGPHIDWNEDNADIDYTIVVYLNDDYEGGELNFVEPELEDFTLSPKAGSIVIFPSFMPYRHQSLEVREGRKMLITHHWKGGARAKRIKSLVDMLRGEEN
tara:strand:- start:2694 stop:3374 length:681 start_codon:yes stop_codon:yes gene_type:complete